MSAIKGGNLGAGERGIILPPLRSFTQVSQFCHPAQEEGNCAAGSIADLTLIKRLRLGTEYG